MEACEIFVQPIEVRFCDLDSLGHINNAVYLSYLEHSRTKWLAASGLCPRDQLHAIPLILARTEIDFVRPGTLGEALTVKTWLTHIGQKSFHMHYEVRSEEQGLVAKAKAVLVWFDHATKASLVIPLWARAILQRYLAPAPS